jgi:amino acid transporter
MITFEERVGMITVAGTIGLLILCASFVFAGTLPADLTWSNPDTLDKIQIEKGSSLAGPFATINQVAAGQTSYTDATNAPGDTACYRAAYINSSGIGPYAGPVCKTFPALPSQTPGSFTVK